MRAKFKYESASKMLRKQYGATGFFWSFGALYLADIQRVKEKILRENNLSEIQTLKSGIEAQVDFGKQITIILAIVTFVLSTILAPMTFYLQQYFKALDWVHEAKMIVVKNKLEDLQTELEKNEFLSKELKNETNDYTKELGKLQDAHYVMLAEFIIPCALVFTALLCRYKWLSSLGYCVNAAYLEKEKQEKQKKDLTEAFQQRRKERMGQRYMR